MLEEADIDDDYFTLVQSTSLANIFGGPSSKETTNETLKYTPSKKHVLQEKNVLKNVETKTDDESKVTECIFASALAAYEWVNNNYLSRGKLGFAILKITKIGCYSMILYNANKTTLSNTPVTEELNMTLKGKNYISYYDTQNKYWSIYSEEEEINRIIEILKTLGVDVKHTLSVDQSPPEPSKVDNNIKDTVSHDKESDTDSSVNRSTKASILNRMANMGQSVLPSSPLVDKSSDSSDSIETDNHPPKVRPKPNKVTAKKASVIDKKGFDPDVVDSKMHVAKIEVSSVQTLNPTFFTMVNGQLVPVSNTSILPAYANSSSSNNDMNLFMTEQRMNNNELRVNINRTTDKVDRVLDKLNYLDRSNVEKRNFQTEIMQKLITEYEYKIKNYEQILSLKKGTDEYVSNESLLESYKMKIADLQSAIEEKDREIVNLNEGFKEHELVEKIARLEEDVALKADKLQRLARELDESRQGNSDSSNEAIQNKLKEVMNNVYHSVANNFERDKTYSGDNVTKVVASILKTITIQSLKE